MAQGKSGGFSLAGSSELLINRYNYLFVQDINPNENDQTMRYRKKIEKDESYVNTALKLCTVLLSNYKLKLYRDKFHTVFVIQESC